MKKTQPVTANASANTLIHVQQLLEEQSVILLTYREQPTEESKNTSIQLYQTLLQSIEKLDVEYACLKIFLNAWVAYNQFHVVLDEEYSNKFIQSMYQLVNNYEKSKKLDLASSNFHKVLFLINEFIVMELIAPNENNLKAKNKAYSVLFLMLDNIAKAKPAIRSNFFERATQAAQFYMVAHQYRYAEWYEHILQKKSINANNHIPCYIEKLLNTYSLVSSAIEKKKEQTLEEQVLLLLLKMHEINSRFADILRTVEHKSKQLPLMAKLLNDIPFAELNTSFKQIAEFISRQDSTENLNGWLDYSLVPGFVGSFNVFVGLFKAFDFLFCFINLEVLNGLVVSDKSNQPVILAINNLLSIAEFLYSLEPSNAWAEIIKVNRTVEEIVKVNEGIARIKNKTQSAQSSQPMLALSELDKINIATINEDIEILAEEIQRYVEIYYLDGVGYFEKELATIQNAIKGLSENNKQQFSIKLDYLTALSSLYQCCELLKDVNSESINKITALLSENRIKNFAYLVSLNRFQDETGKLVADIFVKLVNVFISRLKRIVEGEWTDADVSRRKVEPQLLQVLKNKFVELQVAMSKALENELAPLESPYQLYIKLTEKILLCKKPLSIWDENQHLSELELLKKALIKALKCMPNEMAQEKYLLCALVDYALAKIKNDDDLNLFYKEGILFFNAFQEAKFILLNEQYDTELIYFIDIYIKQVVANAEKLLTHQELGFVMRCSFDILQKLIERDTKHKKAAILLQNKLIYPYELLKLSAGAQHYFPQEFVTNHSYLHYFDYDELLRKWKNDSDKVLSLFSTVYKANATYFAIKIQSTNLFSEENAKSLRKRLLDLPHVIQYLKSNPLTPTQLEGYAIAKNREGSLNIYSEFVKALQQYFDFLIGQLKGFVEIELDEWSDKYKSLLEHAKTFYAIPVVGFVFTKTQTDQWQRKVTSELDRFCASMNKKEMILLSSKPKSAVQPASKPVQALEPTASLAKNNKPKAKKPMMTPMQRLVQLAKKEKDDLSVATAIQSPSDDNDLDALNVELKSPLSINMNKSAALPAKKPLLSLPSEVVDVLEKLGCNAFLVGGALRGGKVNDYDIVVKVQKFEIKDVEKGSSIPASDEMNVSLMKERIDDLMDRKGKWVGKNHPVYNLNVNGHDIQISLMNSRLRDDAKNRGVSCDSLYYSLHYNSYYDFYSSRDHILNKKIVFNKPITDSLSEDPSLIFRVLRLLAGDYSFLNNADVAEMKKAVHCIQVFNPEAPYYLNRNKLYYVMSKCLMVENHDKMLALFKEYNLLEKLFDHSKKNIDFYVYLLTQLKQNDAYKNDLNFLWLVLLYPSIESYESKNILINPLSPNWQENLNRVFFRAGIQLDNENYQSLLMLTLSHLMIKQSRKISLPEDLEKTRSAYHAEAQQFTTFLGGCMQRFWQEANSLPSVVQPVNFFAQSGLQGTAASTGLQQPQQKRNLGRGGKR